MCHSSLVKQTQHFLQIKINPCGSNNSEVSHSSQQRHTKVSWNEICKEAFLSKKLLNLTVEVWVHPVFQYKTRRKKWGARLCNIYNEERVQEEDCKTHHKNWESHTSSPGEALNPFQGSSPFKTAADILKIWHTNQSFDVNWRAWLDPPAPP